MALCSACALRGALAAAPACADGTPDGPSSASDPMPAEGPTRFGDFELLEEIGRGGMGVVYSARQLSLDRVVAVKMLLPGLSGTEHLRRFKTEASTAAGLQHPNIVAIHEVGVWQGRQYLVMDFVEGRSLAQRIAESGRPRDFRQIARWVAAMADAVQYAHDRGILHRDLKPSNVLIDDRDRPRVTDFGLAKRVGDESEMTLSGQALGSPSFMPPEQAGGRGRVSRRSDVYGVGATLYHALTGRAPFHGDTLAEVMRGVLTLNPAPPRSLDPAIPRDLETICLKCLEKDPRRRYASAQAVAEELGRFLDARPILARPVGAAGRLWRWFRRRPSLAALITGVSLSLLAAGSLGWQAFLSSGEQPSLTALLVALSLSVVAAGWLGWRALRSSRQLAHGRVQRAIDAALDASMGGDRAAAEAAIRHAERQGAAAEWVHMLNGQLALYSTRPDHAIAEFEQASALAPRSVAAKAMLAAAYLYTSQYGRYVETLGRLGAQAPETWQDYFFLGAAMVAGHPDSGKTVALLERAKQMRPSGITFLQLAMAEGYHAQDCGRWQVAQRAMDHCRMAEDLLGPAHPSVLAVRMNVLDLALRLCPGGERAPLLEQAASAARALEYVPSAIGRMQRAFYFGIIGDQRAEMDEWRETVRLGGGAGMFASYYAAAMFTRGRAEEALDVLNHPAPSPDALAIISRACLLLEAGRPDDARQHCQQVLRGDPPLQILGEAILLLAGAGDDVAAAATQLLAVVPPDDLDRPVLEYWAGQRSAEDTIAGAGPSRVLQCRTHYFLGLTGLARGDRQSARRHFKESDSAGTHWRTEHQWSRAFLARLERDPLWPPWIPESRQGRLAHHAAPRPDRCQ
ncbi:MAG TPA: serine/threonine-protein kinase [Vicinamibacterales bacterium]|nr:serine/threonine-protein kinase [Vicinamibacterales bacterium]